MGNSYDRFCCISNEDLLEKNMSVSDSNSQLNKDTEDNVLKVSSTNRSVPSSRIIFEQEDIQDQIYRLSRLPISGVDLVRKQKGDPLINYEVIKPLGRGTFGQVYKVVQRATGNIRAMKVIPKNNLKRGFTEDEIEQEINILKNLDHPNIIKLYEFYADYDNYYLINEYCSEGGLDEKIDEIKVIPECVVKVLMIQICRAVAYLYSRKIIHGDLKLENIMVDSPVYDFYNTTFVDSIREDAKSINVKSCNDKFSKQSSFNFDNVSESKSNKSNKTFTKSSDIGVTIYNSSKSPSNSQKMKFSKIKNYEIKLIDFGCSKIFTNYKKNFEDTIGTLMYCSPEVLRNNYNEKCDIWSIGVILYVLLSGKFPFNGRNENEICQKILNGTFNFNLPVFDLVSQQAKDLITKCLRYNKNERISILEVLNHPFFTEDIDQANIFQENIAVKDYLLNLLNAEILPKFYIAVLFFLSHNYADKTEKTKIKNFFFSIDLNKDGKISKDELTYIFQVSGIPVSNEEIENVMNAVDFDKNGYIEYEELVAILISKESLFSEVNLKTAFDFFDLNKDGSISKEEVKEALHLGNNIKQNVIDELYTEIQSNVNEEISFDLFKNYINIHTYKAQESIIKKKMILNEEENVFNQ